ncbi:Gfo/Idh/MocA family oxidoreductase, partial [bacterium]|nr:Gfo/Idh/MocA family oxidoreductase [bacterium]
MEKWQELSILIVGCGSIGKRHGQVLQSLGVADIRVCDPIAETREVMAKLIPGVKLYESFEAGLEDKPDTVLVCTEPTMHIPMITQAVKAGCHVLCEKPISNTPEGIDELEELVEKTGKKVMV